MHADNYGHLETFHKSDHIVVNAFHHIYVNFFAVSPNFTSDFVFDWGKKTKIMTQNHNCFLDNKPNQKRPKHMYFWRKA